MVDGKPSLDLSRLSFERFADRSAYQEEANVI